MANEAPFDDMFIWYEELYPSVDSSKAYSEYCKRVHGEDLSQQNFCTIDQIDFMLSEINLSADSQVLDIGCGTGKLAEYISNISKATVYGFDYSPTAIRLASERTYSKRDKLIFENGDINDKEYPPDTFDAIISVDSLYFANDLENAITKMYSWLHLKGMLAFYYSVMRFDRKESKDIMSSKKTPLAKALINAGIAYSVFDFTKECYEHQKLKRKTALDLKNDFKEEGTIFLFDYLFRESISEDMSFEDYKEFCARFLYICRKT